MAGRVGGAERRELIVEAVRQFHAEHGYGPSLRELADASGIGLSSTAYHVGVLVSDGVLTNVRLRPRSLRVADPHIGEPL